MCKKTVLLCLALTTYTAHLTADNNFTTNWHRSYEEEKASFEHLKQLAHQLMHKERFNTVDADTIRQEIYTNGSSPVFYDNGKVYLLSRILNNYIQFTADSQTFRAFVREISDAELVALTQLRAQYGA